MEGSARATLCACAWERQQRLCGFRGGSADAGGRVEETDERNVEAERIDREALEARLGRGGYVVGAMWDEGNMVHAIRKFGGTTMGWRFGDG